MTESGTSNGIRQSYTGGMVYFLYKPQGGGVFEKDYKSSIQPSKEQCIHN